jgi:hypothetical protein
MMIRMFASALLVAGLTQAALAQSGNQQNQSTNPAQSSQDQSTNSAQNTQAAQALPQELSQRLTSAGFSDVKVVPSSFVVSAKDKDGRPVLMRITPTSMTVLTEVPVSSSTTGSGNNNNSSNSGASGLGGSGSGGMNPSSNPGSSGTGQGR